MRLTNILVSDMQSLGAEEVKLHTKKHIRRKLESVFGDSLEMVADDSGRMLVIPDNLSRAMLAKENMRLSRENESLKVHDQDLVLKQCALKLRDDMKSSKSQRSWPPQPENLDNDYIPLPKSISTFLQLLLTGKSSTADTFFWSGLCVCH